MMDAAKHRSGDDRAIVVVIHRPVGDPLSDSLMGPDSVEIAHVLACDLTQMVFAGQEHMVECLAPQTADEPFTNGIHVRGTHRRLDHPYADALERELSHGAAHAATAKPAY